MQPEIIEQASPELLGICRLDPRDPVNHDVRKHPLYQETTGKPTGIIVRLRVKVLPKENVQKADLALKLALSV